jgi:hypothetical protein
MDDLFQRPLGPISIILNFCGLSDLENDLWTSITSEGAQSFFSKITFLKSVDQAEKNEL